MAASKRSLIFLKIPLLSAFFELQSMCPGSFIGALPRDSFNEGWV